MNARPPKIDDESCLTLIGMAGAGKTTLGRELAARLGWAQVDTDHVIEAWWGRPLQDISDALGKQEFIRAEEEIVSMLTLKRCVISTGGSVVYGPKAVAHLRELGPVVFLCPGLEKIVARVASNPQRGLAIAPGQTVEDLYNERRPLYEAAADFSVDTGARSAARCAQDILEWLQWREKD
jgi:shikimate kinase